MSDTEATALYLLIQRLVGGFHPDDAPHDLIDGTRQRVFTDSEAEVVDRLATTARATLGSDIYTHVQDTIEE